jgi:hypothetical protein
MAATAPHRRHIDNRASPRVWAKCGKPERLDLVADGELMGILSPPAIGGLSATCRCGAGEPNGLLYLAGPGGGSRRLWTYSQVEQLSPGSDAGVTYTTVRTRLQGRSALALHPCGLLLHGSTTTQDANSDVYVHKMRSRASAAIVEPVPPLTFGPAPVLTKWSVGEIVRWYVAHFLHKLNTPVRMALEQAADLALGLRKIGVVAP